MAVRVRVSRRKEIMRKEFEDYLKRYRYVIILDAYRLKASMLNEVRRLQSELGFRIKGGKKRVFLKAVEQIYPESVKDLEEKFEGQILFIFTNENPFKIAAKLDKFEMAMDASPGDIAPDDIVIPEGNTGIPPGPVIGLFSALSIPTKIVAGAIYIAKDVLVAKKGDRISANLANILSKLGIKPIKSRVYVKFAYDFHDKILVERELLLPDIDKLREDFMEVYKRAYYLALGIEYITRETIIPLLSRAFSRANILTIESEYIDRSTVDKLITAAISRAMLVRHELGVDDA